jgi:AbrB family looped-hinge helix DNA binding protein
MAMKITSKGQVAIPQSLRDQFGLLPNTEVEFVVTRDGKELQLVKSTRRLAITLLQLFVHV